MSDDEHREWLAGCTNEQLDTMIERLPALSKEEKARGMVIRDGAAWRIEVDGQVILSSDEELPGYVPGRRQRQAPGQ